MSDFNIGNDEKTVQLKAKFITEVTITDPDSKAPIEISIFKDPESGALFGIDSSFLEQVQDEIPSPFNKNSILKCES